MKRSLWILLTLAMTVVPFVAGCGPGAPTETQVEEEDVALERDMEAADSGSAETGQ